MVRKLLKHELQYYFRSLSPVYIILVVVALLGRLVLCFEQDAPAYYILMASSVAMFFIACAAALFLCTIFSLVRFYKNMFSGEGYLTMTLPATPAQLLFVKLLVAWLAEITTAICIVLSACLLMVGPWLVEIIKAVVYIYKVIYGNLGSHPIWYTLEYAVVLIISLLPSIMMYYTCLCVGQLAKKNRILASIGVYFGFYVINQISSTIFFVGFTILTAAIPPEKLEQIAEWMQKLVDSNQIYYLYHGIFGVVVVWSLVLAAIYFLVCRFILSRKLNLE